MLNPLACPSCLETPNRLTGMSAWHQHIPFAMYITAALRPRSIVELGTHSGDSYCAFCQAVKALGIDCRCFAVDTWRGDEHSGPYGPDVLADLRAHHDALYAGFSSLMQMTFDEARDRFADGSIDLLHIDGLHTYEAVKHDFDGWLPKLTDTGIVLLHDISVHADGFGVWRFWEELRDRFPSFDFRHGNGLGVVAVGGQVPTGLRDLFCMEATDAQMVREHFFTIGRSVESARQLACVTAEREATARDLRTLVQTQVARASRLLGQAISLDSWRRLAASSRTGISVALDQPIEASHHSRFLQVAGWADSSKSRIARVVVALEDGTQLGSVPYGQYRPDVLAARPWQRDALSGFSGIISLGGVHPGNVRLVVRVVDQIGHQVDIRRVIRVGPDCAS